MAGADHLFIILSGPACELPLGLTLGAEAGGEEDEKDWRRPACDEMAQLATLSAGP